MTLDDKKIPVCCTWYLRNYISYDCHLWYTCVKWWYLQVFFFIFSKFLILWVVTRGGEGGAKGQKIVQNEKKFCLPCFISQESYIIWFSFMVLKMRLLWPLKGESTLQKQPPKGVLQICLATIIKII